MKVVRVILFCAGMLAVVVFSLFVHKFGIGYWETVEEWAQTGDFFGGILNPIFAFFSLILIAYTLFQNKTAIEQNKEALHASNEELKLSRIEYSKSVDALKGQVEQFNFQRFENTFFNMLSLQNEILNELEFKTENLSASKNPNEDSTRSRYVFGSILRWIDGSDGTDPFDNYDYFQVHENQVVGHYFRNLYQILKFVDDATLSDGDKVKYARILRGQLSSDEIALLFFNCLSSKVDSGQFKEYVIKYKMLEHMSINISEYSDDDMTVSTQQIYVPLTTIDFYVNGDKSAFGSNSAVASYLKTKI
ncbi:putative phage abortive infection protein [Vibrio parahaemolyticus]|uniref:putative phage abortive infection protein n=1 Tax=Vibrio parahaemolyticus TaxID=670 RepID=UPI0023610F1C|nr:putative phage abortive infection protein [Vibrio parahaemolyticus]